MTTVESGRSLGLLGRICRACVYGVLVYWGLYALVTPVTTDDSQIYNVARLALAQRGGFFGNPYWTSPLHVMIPWTFDAVHLPFLQLGFGFGLPSFLCLVGTLVAVFRMMRDRFGPDAAWLTVAGLLALPCLVYQATSTKTDIPLVFCSAVWAYGFWRWRRERTWPHLFWMVLAIGFMVGAKTTGLVFGPLLALATLLSLRRNRLHLMRVTAGLAAAVLLFGGVENYVESARLYRNPLGPPWIVNDLRNQHGLRGLAANFSRYVAGGVYLGQSEWEPSRAAITRLADAERWAFARLGWLDAGSNFRSPDADLFFHQSGLEEFSGFGPLGTAAMVLMLAACVRWRPRDWSWRLAIAALGCVLLISLTVVYSMWNNRYLLVPYSLLVIGCVCFLWEGEGRWRHLLRWCLAVVAVPAAVAAPLLSFNRTPASLVAAVCDRTTFETINVPIDGRVRARLHELRAATPQCRIVIGVYHDSVVLPYLTDRTLAANVVANAAMPALLQSGKLAAGDLVVLEFEVALPQLAPVETVTAPNLFGLSRGRTLAPIQRFIYRYRTGG